MFFLLIIIIIIYIRVTKIPILCLACEKDGTFTRCITGTGDGTPTCDAYNLEHQVLDNINMIYNDVENSFGQVTGAFDDAFTKINIAKQTLTDAFNSIGSLDIPTISSINIPSITNISCNIDFGAVPNIDLCKDINSGIDNLQNGINNTLHALNTAIDPINISLTNTQTKINNIVGNVNSVVDKVNNKINLGIPKIGNVNFGTINTTINDININKNNISCGVNIPELIRNNMDSTSINVCALLVDQINKSLVPQLNTAFKAVKDGINTAITSINDGIKQSIKTIQDGISTAILMLEQQLNSIKIFAQLTSRIVDLISKIQKLDPIGLIKIYVVPYISAIFPFATLADILTFLLFLVIIPFIIPIFLIINSLINLIPDIDIPIFGSKNEGTNNDESQDDE
jgi:hypothetical protein